MSLSNITKRHRLRYFRETVTSGASGGKLPQIVELGTVYGTVNPDIDLESPEHETYNEQISSSIYFDFNPTCKTNDYYQVTAVLVQGGYKTITNGQVWRVESVLDFQQQNRLWRVRATKRELLAS